MIINHHTSYDPSDWYWIVGGEGPHKAAADAAFSADDSRVYSSARGRYVPVDDKKYLAWKDKACLVMSLSDPATRIDSEENLADVLKAHAIVATFPK